MLIKLKKLDPRAVIPTRGSAAAAGSDLYALEAVTVPAGETVIIHTGIAIALPQGYAGLIYARSGLATKRDLAPANKVGVIDADYRGEIMVALHNHGTEPQEIAAGERVAQLVVTPFLPVSFGECDALDETERGTGGFGSTGTGFRQVASERSDVPIKPIKKKKTGSCVTTFLVLMIVFGMLTLTIVGLTVPHCLDVMDEPDVYQSSAQYYLSPQEVFDTPEELNNNLVIGSKYIDTLEDYLMTKETMAFLLAEADKCAARDPEGYKTDHEYTAEELLTLFTFISPDDSYDVYYGGESALSLVFKVKCKAYSAKDSRILLDVFGRVINERCQSAVLMDVYEVQTIALPMDGECIYSGEQDALTTGIAFGVLAFYSFSASITFLVFTIVMRRKARKQPKRQ